MVGSELLQLQISTWLAILYTFTQYKLKGDGATPAGIACVLRLQAQAMPAESVATPNTQYCKLVVNIKFSQIQISHHTL